VNDTASTDIVIVGAGAAGLAAAIFARRRSRDRGVVLLDGARKPGAKILVSGGSRCNVTNTVVTERDYWGGPPAIIRRVLRALPVRDTIAFFAEIGVPLHEEPGGKLFPDSNSSRHVLEALLGEAETVGVDLRAPCRVQAIAPNDGRFTVTTDRGMVDATNVVLATGGLSLPKSGSNGAGYAMATALGHSIVPTTPALAPLVLEATGDAVHADVSGVTIEAQLTLWVDDAAAIKLRGSLLWTHFGVSGPVVLDMSRHWLRARLEGSAIRLTASLVADWGFETADAFWRTEARARPHATVNSTLARLLPASLATVVASRLAIEPSTSLAHLTKDDRRRLAHALTGWPLHVVDSRGYQFAEATAGGVDLREIDPSTMESRLCPGLYLVGEVLDVDGRIGGFNFQWAWSSAFVAARALTAG
jgi:predicted Rossmann fold flavoprotein